ncbi:UNVERIFIED_CONTAM: uncharacterized protein DUF3794 [Acetivibrio alkalicellulosi]
MKSNTSGCNCDSALIDIIGLCNPSNITEVINNYPYWKQMYISEKLTIPSNKPDIEQINSVDISVSIIRKKVIKTPTIPIPNIEGKLLSGRKLIIEGQLCQKIVYTADIPDQPVHSVHFYVPFSSFIVVPEEVTFEVQNGQDITRDSLDVNYEVNSCVEDVSACILDNRSILKQVTLLLYAVPTQNC